MSSANIPRGSLQDGERLYRERKGGGVSYTDFDREPTDVPFGDAPQGDPGRGGGSVESSREMYRRHRSGTR